MTATSTMYLMEDPREARRLAEKVEPTLWVDNYVADRLRAGIRVLDVGCGPCVLAAAVAARSPEIEVVGLDISTDRIAEARRVLQPFENARVVQGDARTLPFGSDTFDLVYCRLLLEYLPNREQAVAEMVRVARPGGRVLLQDLDGQLLWHYPVDDTLQQGLERVLAVLGQVGFDPFVGRKLYALARAAGLEAVEVRAEPYHLIAGAADGRTIEQWALKLDIAEPAATRALGSLEEARSLKARFLEHLAHPETLTYSTVFTVSGTKPFTPTLV